jgi:hypothetical protein
VFVIVQVFWSPATIVPVQSADKVTVKPATTRPVSVTLNAPGPNVTRVPFTLAANVGGVGLLPVTVIVNSDITGHSPPAKHTSTFLTNKVPVVAKAAFVRIVFPRFSTKYQVSKR